MHNENNVVSEWADTMDDVPQGPSGEQLSVVIGLAQRQTQLEDYIELLERDLDQSKADLRRIQERELPDAMQLAGIENYTLNGGRKVEIVTSIVASPTNDQKPLMLEWLQNNNHADIVKHELKIGFGKGEDDIAKKLKSWLGMHLPKQKVDDKTFVHPQTLNGFVREMFREGYDIPDTFNVTFLRKSVVSRPKGDGPL
jgi:hypothetical protein